MRVEKLTALLARLHALPRRRLTLVVAVDGLPGSGKTTFTSALAGADPELDVVSVESFYQPDGHSPSPRAGSPADLLTAGLDWRRLRSQVLLPLGRDQTARYLVQGRDGGGAGSWRELPVGGIVLVEGLYACISQLADLYDFRIWVECAPEVRELRSNRDAREEPGGRVDPSAGDASRGGLEAYLSSHDPVVRADLRVDGSGRLPHDLGNEYVRLSRWPSGSRSRRS
jgi:uridine kinase